MGFKKNCVSGLGKCRGKNGLVGQEKEEG